MSSKQGHILLNKNLQLKFMGEENEELREKVQNLEQNLKVNKEIMNSLLKVESQGPPTDGSASTSAETQLNNSFKRQIELLEKRIGELESKAEEASAQKLVMSQIIQNVKNQEDAQMRIFQEESKKQKDEIDRKEFTLQQLELKMYHYEKYLQRKGLLEKEARNLLNKFQLDEQVKDQQRVSNVVKQNLALREELKESFKEVNRLERTALKQKETVNQLKKKIDQIKLRHIKELKDASSQ